MRHCVVVLLACAFVSPAWAGPHVRPVAYGDYVEQVLANYPSLKREGASVERAIAAKAAVAAAQMPQVWASLGAEYGNDPVYVFGALLRQNRFSATDFALDHLNTPTSRRDSSAAAGGEWLLFDFFATTGKIKASGLLKESAVYREEFTRMEGILAASEVYERLSVTDRWLSVIKVQAAEGARDIAAMEALRARGLVLGADFHSARMRLSELMTLKNETVAQRAALEIVFNILRGSDPLTPVAVSPTLRPVGPAGGDVQAHIAMALSRRADITAMQKLLEAGRVNVGVARKSIAPKIAAYGNVAEHGRGWGGGTGESYMVGVKAKVDLDPGYGARVKLAKAEAKQLEAELAGARDKAARDAAEAYYRLEALRANLGPARQTWSDSREVVQLLVPLYREGRRSAEDMVSARVARVLSYERWLKLTAAGRMTLLDLQFLTGRLTPTSAKEVYGQ